MVLLELKDVNILDIDIESETSLEVGGYCETCYYEYDVIDGKVSFYLDDEREHTFVEVHETGASTMEEALGFTVGDLMKAFLDKDFINLLKETLLEDFNKVLAIRLWEMAESPYKKEDLSNLFYDIIDAHVTEKLKNEK